jgi:hypothetical protein
MTSSEPVAATPVHLSPYGIGRIAQAIRVRGISPREKLLLAFADADPSSVADFVRATFSHKGRRKKIYRA